MNFNLHESTNEELVEIITNKEQYSDEMVQIALDIIQQRKTNFENESKLIARFSRNKNYKLFTIVMTIFLLAEIFRVIISHASIFDFFLIGIVLFWVPIFLFEYNPNYIELYNNSISINKPFGTKSFLWSDIDKICVLKNNFIGIILKNEKTIKIYLRGIDKKVIPDMISKIEQLSTIPVIKIQAKQTEK